MSPNCYATRLNNLCYFKITWILFGTRDKTIEHVSHHFHKLDDLSFNWAIRGLTSSEIWSQGWQVCAQRLAPNGTNPAPFQISFQYILARRIYPIWGKSVPTLEPNLTSLTGGAHRGLEEDKKLKRKVWPESVGVGGSEKKNI